MSRHKLVKTMDLNDELDDFDGGDDDYDEDAGGEEGTGCPQTVRPRPSEILSLTQSVSRIKPRG